MTAVAGIFDNNTDANLAMTQLMNAGFKQEDVSLLVSDKGRDRIFTNDTTVKKGANDAAAGGLTGAVAGGALGAIIAGLTAVGSIAVPGAGILMAGPIVAALSGAGAGGALGGLSGALVGAGFSKDDAGKFASELEAGKAVIVVHPDNDKEEAAARTILNMSGGYTKAA